MPVLVEVLGTDVSKLILRLDVVNTDSSFLYEFLNEEEAQSNVFHSRAISLVAGDVKSRGVVDVHRYVVEPRTKSQLLHHIEAKTASFTAKAAATSSASMVNCAIIPCNPERNVM